LGAVTAVLGGVYRLTDGRHRLRLDRLTAEGHLTEQSGQPDMLTRWAQMTTF
jgi:hypothetical protein